MTQGRLATDADDLTVEQLNGVLAAHAPGVSITGFTVTETYLWGSGQASSAGRLVIKPTYAHSSPDLPRNIVVKVARTDLQSDDPKHVRGAGALYRNEVNVYNRLQPSTFVEAARTFGGVYHPETSTFLLLMEDLRERGATFGAVTVPVSLAGLRSLLDQLATLHARFWQSPELATSLNWMEAHTRGELYHMYTTPEIVPAFIAHQIETTQFKREMVQRLRTTAAGLFEGMCLVQQHQARLPQTVCHGDTHIGNTYFRADGGGGLLDWQLASQGYAMHDVSYVIATALTVEDRRTHERDLLAYYLEQLRSKGVAEPPRLDDFWLEYRRAIVWGVYIGWLTTPVVNYGWDVSVMNHVRLMTAYEDLEASKAIAALR